MKLLRRQFLTLAAAAATAPAMPRSASALDYPVRQLRWIVGFTPGGGADIAVRIMAQWLSARLGQSIVIENKPGASSNISIQAAVSSPPDGYTLLFVAASAAVNVTLFDNLPFDLVRDIAPVAGLIDFPLVMVVNAALCVKTLKEFVALARSKPGGLNYGTTGVGSSNHLVTELFASRAGIRMTHIPYRGTALAVTDLLAGQVQLVFSDPISSMQYVKSGALVALAVTSKNRSPIAADVPTIAESGYPGFDALAWHGILAPAHTPPAIVAKLNTEIVKALNDPETKALLATQAIEPVGSSPEAFADFIKRDISLWKDVAEKAKIEVR